MTKTAFDELFTATLGMFSLSETPATGVLQGNIRDVFTEVLKARVTCERIFSQKPSDYVPGKNPKNWK